MSELSWKLPKLRSRVKIGADMDLHTALTQLSANERELQAVLYTSRVYFLSSSDNHSLATLPGHDAPSPLNLVTPVRRGSCTPGPFSLLTFFCSHKNSHLHQLGLRFSVAKFSVIGGEYSGIKDGDRVAKRVEEFLRTLRRC